MKILNVIKLARQKNQNILMTNKTNIIFPQIDYISKRSHYHSYTTTHCLMISSQFGFNIPRPSKRRLATVTKIGRLFEGPKNVKNMHRFAAFQFRSNTIRYYYT
jgi:hypothetical protein